MNEPKTLHPALIALFWALGLGAMMLCLKLLTGPEGMREPTNQEYQQFIFEEASRLHREN